MNHDTFDIASRLCELYTGRPWDGTTAHLVEVTTRQAETGEILAAHDGWLSATKAAVEVRGDRWNTVSCREQSRRDGDLATPPEWLAERFERESPEGTVNR
ncbi:hypothetical protein ABLE94_02685 [Gordonia sp. VNK1]|uniref:hypothetical protein n=1 Tax=Gordonia oleivorans TaxID=3156618 RepID=UPI0032B31251